MTRDRAGRIAATTVAAILPLGFLAIFFALPVAGMLARGFAPGGVLVIPVRGRMLRVHRHADGSTTTDHHGWYSFVPLLRHR